MVAFVPDFSKIEKQTIAFNTLKQPAIDELLYGGAKGGGKSVFGCLWCYLQAYEIAQRFFPKAPPTHPLTVGFMGRKVGKDFKDTTLGTWKRFIPFDRYKIVGKPAEIIIEDRVKILTGGLDRSEEVQKFNSAELAFFFIDQAEETNVDDISVLRASLRLTIQDKELAYKGLFTANPRTCWLKDEFISNPTPNRKFVQALPGDNPLLPKKYIETLRDAFKHRPELLQAYLFGDWDSFEGPEQIIKDAWLRNAKESVASERVHKKYLVCDTARFGDDETVIFLMDNAEIEKQVIMPYCDHDEIAGRLAILSAQNDDCTIVVESVGSDIGAAVITDLRKMKKHVIEYTPQGQSIDPDKFYNQRAEAWHTAAKILSDGKFDRITNCPVNCRNMDSKTRGQLCVPTYEYRNGKILIESKKKIKTRLGNSPDRADTYVIGLWAWKKINAKPIRDRDRERSRGKILSPMAM
ncbi:hypothetical protein LCGC14_0403600 [marine sediment metagenome]|uniref:Phage terminase large subunit N-terminal domain-containing protein n=1 Tax=marine sediment metagenome TaxID=412755 RepID=A0A0F9TE78_9ZZZZ